VSRGHGRVQRAILEMIATPEANAPYVSHRLLASGDKSGPVGLPVSEVARRLYSTEKSPRAQQEAVNRAIRRLESGGLVQINHYWDGDGTGVRARHVRKPPD